MRIYSIFVLIAFAWKIAIWLGWYRLTSLIQDARIAPLLEPYIAPAQLPLWQLGAAVSAFLAWLLYFLADKHLRAIKRDDPNRASDASIKRQIWTITVTRSTLALYTIACTLYITISIAADYQWPPLEIVLFPWDRPSVGQ